MRVSGSGLRLCRLSGCAAALLIGLPLPGANAAVSGAEIAGHGAGSAVPACISCHGKVGEGNVPAGFPRLAGLPASYIAAQLRSFAAGTRRNSLMMPIAQALNDAQINALANYYSRLRVPATPYGAMPAANDAREGERLAKRGNWHIGVAACFRCHGPGGAGVGGDFPPLTGQPASYIEAQIKGWKDGTRRNDPNGLMHTIAVRLTEGDTRAIALWLAAQKPVAPSTY